MLVSKEVEVTLVAYNTKYYENLGYNLPKVISTYSKNKGKLVNKLGEKIMVKIEDLPLHSGVTICAKCDFCGNDIFTKYALYNRTKLKYGENNLDACIECASVKTQAMRDRNNKLNLLDINERGYWQDINKVIKEFNNYYKIYGSFTSMRKNKYGQSIINALTKHKENVQSMAFKLGYTIQDLGRVPSGWYNSFEVFKNDIVKLINKLNRFPTSLEIQKELRIGSITIQKHGGMQEIKKKIGYSNNNDLVDDNGYYNSSSFEYITAQFLIHNTSIEYERNIIISPDDGKYNCDFRAIYRDNGIEKYLWIEVWGGYGGFDGEYNNTHDIKMNIYDKLNYKLISLYPSDFNKRTYEEVQDRLYEILKPYVSLKYKHIENKYITTYKYKSDEELINELFTYSDDGFYLPTDTKIQKSNYKLYDEIYKRFGNFGNMAIKYNMVDKLKVKSANVKKQLNQTIINNVQVYN